MEPAETCSRPALGWHDRLELLRRHLADDFFQGFTVNEVRLPYPPDTRPELCYMPRHARVASRSLVRACQHHLAPPCTHCRHLLHSFSPLATWSRARVRFCSPLRDFSSADPAMAVTLDRLPTGLICPGMIAQNSSARVRRGAAERCSRTPSTPARRPATSYKTCAAARTSRALAVPACARSSLAVLRAGWRDWAPGPNLFERTPPRPRPRPPPRARTRNRNLRSFRVSPAQPPPVPHSACGIGVS